MQKTPVVSAARQQRLRGYFDEIDTNKNGKIEASELAGAMSKAGFNFPDRVIKRMIASVAKTHNGSVAFEEFADLTAFLDQMKTTFTREDSDHNGKLDKAEIGCALIDSGFNLNSAAISHLLAAVDRNHSGTVEFDEFIDLSFYLKLLHEAFSKACSDGKLAAKDLPGVFNRAGVSTTGLRVDALEAGKDQLTFDDVIQLARASN